VRLVPTGTSPLKAALVPIGPQYLFSASQLSEKPSYPIRSEFIYISLSLPPFPAGNRALRHR
jgi:hypothetical protein